MATRAPGIVMVTAALGMAIGAMRVTGIVMATAALGMATRAMRVTGIVMATAALGMATRATGITGRGITVPIIMGVPTGDRPFGSAWASAPTRPLITTA